MRGTDTAEKAPSLFGRDVSTCHCRRMPMPIREGSNLGALFS
jgi:hypothetical protein